VSAITSDQIQAAGINSIQDIGKAVSGVTFGLSPQDAGFRVRGVGSMGGFTSASESPVGIVVDGVVMGLGPVVESMIDVERIEALKGPQGTQFGKNASSGVVSITTRRPKLGRTEGEASASFGSLSERQLNATVNLPLGETVAARVSLFERSHGGYVENITRNETWGGLKAYGARVKLLFKPSEALDVLFSVDATKIEGDGPGQLWTLRRPSPAAPAPAGITASATNTQTTENAASFEDQGSSGGSLEVNYRLGDYTLTSVTAHREREIQCRFGLDTTAAPRFEGGCDKDYEQDSQELRITSPRGRVEYVAGVFWSKVLSDTRDSAWLNVAPGVFANLTNGVNRTVTDTRSTALFADGKLRLSDTTSLLAGVRLTRDEVEARNATDTSGPLPQLGRPPGFLTPGTAREQQGDSSASKPSGRLGGEWKPSADLLVYATAARGYLGPTTTFSGTNGTRTDVSAQTVDDITIGFKSQWLDRRLTLNGSVFNDTYKNLQVGVFDGIEFLTQNAGGMRSRGIELDTSLRFGGGLTGRASITYADAQFTDFVTSCPGTGDRTRCYTVGTSTTLLYQAAGQPLTGAPKVTASLGLDYGTTVGSFLLDASASASYRSKASYGVGETDYVQDAFTVVNAAIKLSPDHEKWHVGVFARNLFDEHYQAAVIGLPFTAPGGVVNWNTRDARRTIGVTVGVKF
jgi:iron complex outermembrane recepter protein